MSADRQAVYDCNDSTSYFMMALEFLLGNSENLKRSSGINGGIYAAKKKEGRYLEIAPYGYKNVRGEKNLPGIAPDEERAPIVKMIFELFRQSVPSSEILKQARARGFSQLGNSALRRIVSNKVYIGLLHVKAFKDFPEEWVEGIHRPLIDKSTWYAVQDKLKGGKPRRMIIDDMPLRGVLRCHCNKPLTGASSRGKGGKYWNYYKCHESRHNNIPATRAHEQLKSIWQHLSLPDYIVSATQKESERLLGE